MSSELLYTSAPQGLKGGSRGFTTVLCTAGMPPNLADKLESFSGYKHVYSPQDPLAEHNPVRYAYLKPSVGGRALTVVSRLAAYGVDYSGRSNKIAHHIVLETSERPGGGPAWLLSQSNLWKASWDGQCKTVPAGPRIPSGDVVASVCRRWEAVTGDAGWGGQLVTWLKQSTKPIWLIYEPTQGSHVLHLLVEALALLPETERWKYTFATYFSGLPGDVECRIRGVVSGSDEARLASARGHVIDLTRNAPLATSSIWIEAARTGILPSVSKEKPIMSGLSHDADLSLGGLEPSSVVDSEELVILINDESSSRSDLRVEGDLLVGPIDYRLGPPPIGNDRRSQSSPPALPAKSGQNKVSKSVLRWFGRIAAITVVLMLAIGTVYHIRKNYAQYKKILDEILVSTNQNKNNEQKSSTTEVSKNEEQSESEVAANQEANAGKQIPEPHMDHEEKQVLKLTLKSADGNVQDWTNEGAQVWTVKVDENFEGYTGYEIENPLGHILKISEQSLLTVNGGKIEILQKQDFEKREKIDCLLTVQSKDSDLSGNIKILVNIDDFEGNVKATDIKLEMDIDKSKSLEIKMEDHLGSLDEVKDFDISIKKSNDVVGEFSWEKDVKKIVYTYARNATKKSKAECEYELTCSYKGVPEKTSGKIAIELEGEAFRPKTIPKGSATVVKEKGDYSLNFSQNDLRNIFTAKGNYELQFFGESSTPIGDKITLKLITSGPILKNKSREKEMRWGGIGVMLIDPADRDGGKIQFKRQETPEICENFDHLFARERFLEDRENIKEEIKKSIDAKLKQLWAKKEMWNNEKSILETKNQNLQATIDKNDPLILGNTEQKRELNKGKVQDQIKANNGVIQTCEKEIDALEKELDPLQKKLRIIEQISKKEEDREKHRLESLLHDPENMKDKIEAIIKETLNKVSNDEDLNRDLQEKMNAKKHQILEDYGKAHAFFKSLKLEMRDVGE